MSEALRRAWGLIPVVLVVAIFAIRGCAHAAPLSQLAFVASEPGDPPHTSPRAGSIAITRGGPVFLGFVSPTRARLTVAGHEIVGSGSYQERIVLPHGPTAIRFAAPAGARLVWAPVGRRGEGEYVSASSLSSSPPERATFEHPGTDLVDGWCGLALLVVIAGTGCALARHRLARIDRAGRIALAAVFALALAARLVGLGDQGQTWDEDVNWTAGRNYVTNVLALDGSEVSWRWNQEHPPVMKYLDGIGAELADGYQAARALSALWLALGCALLVPIGTRLFNRRVGLLAGIIAALLPTLVAHGQIVGHESPTVLWWALGILLALGVHDGLPIGFVDASRERAQGRKIPRRTVEDALAIRTLTWRLVATGVVVGVAIGSRFVNGLLGPLCLAIVGLRSPRVWRRVSILRGLILMPAAAVVAFYVLWPRLWGHPIAALRGSLAKLTHLHSPEPFLGTITNHPGPHYFLVYLLATLPLGLLIGVIAFGVRARRERTRSTLVVAAMFVIPLVIVLSPVRQDGVRYVMPCLLALCVAAAAGFDHVASRFAERFQDPRAFAVLAGGVGLYLTATLAIAHPYYLDYFGEQVGGAGTVMRHQWFETAWWGEGLAPAIEYVNDHAAPHDPVVRCIDPAHLGWFREDLFDPASPKTAKWFVVYSPQSRGCSIPADAKLVFEERAHGVTYARVFAR